ncbi:MAG: hypothetical protein HQK84_11845 [Nitrospinae bacterium]|nr:hypothetical protein [Nitrospinota bacterium]
MNNIAPEITAPADATVVSSGVSPTFTWTANGDPNSGKQHNNFTLVISKDDFATSVIEKTGITSTSYTFSDSDWQTVVAQASANTTFKWHVKGYNDASPRMPASDGFMSNTHSFTMRAYHIQVTWSPVGADVDLHFTNPSGSDCYYSNRNPDWGVTGVSTDDPSLDRDCITSCAEENTTIGSVVDSGTYTIWVKYYSDHGKGPASVTIKIYQFGSLLTTKTTTLAATGDTYTALSFTIGGAGRPAFKFIDKLISGNGIEPPKKE